jgi:hypothetical protein
MKHLGVVLVLATAAPSGCGRGDDQGAKPSPPPGASIPATPPKPKATIRPVAFTPPAPAVKQNIQEFLAWSRKVYQSKNAEKYRTTKTRCFDDGECLAEFHPRGLKRDTLFFYSMAWYKTASAEPLLYLSVDGRPLLACSDFDLQPVAQWTDRSGDRQLHCKSGDIHVFAQMVSTRTTINIFTDAHLALDDSLMENLDPSNGDD